MTNPYESSPSPAREPSATLDGCAGPPSAEGGFARGVLTVLRGALMVGIPCEIWLQLNFLHPGRAWILACAMASGGLVVFLVRNAGPHAASGPVPVRSWFVLLALLLLWIVLLPEAVDPRPAERFRQRLRQQLREQTESIEAGEGSWVTPRASIMWA